MQSVNEVRISGRATRDAERIGKGPYKFAISYSYGNSDAPAQGQQTEFFECVWWSDRGALVKKGDELEITGRLRQARWESNGQKHSRVEVVAKEVSGLPLERIAAEAEKPLTPKYLDIETGADDHR